MDRKSTSLASPESFSTFGELLRYLRRRAGLTQRELALEVGYSEPQISFLEKNHRLPDITTVAARFIPALDLDYVSPLARRLIQLAEAARIDGQPGREAPYKGLQFFDVQDADLFYGRELLTAQLVQHLHRHQFLAIVVGASGSGKSSIVRAGLIPAMRRGQRLADGSLPPPGSSHWKYVVITPGANPLGSLIAALQGNESGVRALSKAVRDFIADETSLDGKAQELFGSQKTNRDHILLIVDQFEELFTLCENEKIRRAFIDNLMFSASAGSIGLVSVVITLRADFYAHCAQYPNLRDALAHYQEYIGPMTREEIRRAIEQPALNAGLDFEPGLVDSVLKEMGDEPGALPLLSHALLETWKRRQHQTLTFRGYNQSGGIRGAIAKTAEEVYGTLDAKQQAFARRIFLSLTELGQTSEEGLPTPDTRRRVKLKELIRSREETKSMESLLKLLSDARLIIVTEDSAEVAHEALIREWPRLREWLTEDRENLILHRQIHAAADRWEADGRKPEDIYRGSRLSQALEWAEKNSDELSAPENSFLDVSRAWSESELERHEAERRKELLAAQKLAESESHRAEEQNRASQRLRRRAWILSGLLVTAGILAVAALGLGRQRDAAARLATSRELSAASVSNLGVDPERSILLALEALSVAQTHGGEQALHQAVMASRIETRLNADEDVYSIAYSPDGARFATAGSEGVVKIREVKSGKQLLTLAGHTAPVGKVVFSPDGKLIATASDDATAKIWDSVTGRLIKTLNGHTAEIRGVAFSRDGKRLATASGDQTWRIWDVEDGSTLLAGPERENDRVHMIGVIFSPDGSRIVTTSSEGVVEVWDSRSGEQVGALFNTAPAPIFDLDISPDGKRLATTSQSSVRISDLETGEILSTLAGHTNSVFDVAYSPDGSRLATGGLDRNAKVWDADSGEVLLTLSGHQDSIGALDFSPDGEHLATASADGTVRTWDLNPQSEVFTTETKDSFGRIAFSPDGTAIAAGDMESVKVWDVADGHEPFSFETPTYAMGVAFDPVNARLAGAAESGEVTIWDLQTGEPEVEIKASDQPILFLAFSPDGRKLASVGEDNLVKVWDSNTGDPLLSLVGHHNPVTSVAFSSDGKRLASSGVDNIAIVWDASNGEELLTLRGHNDVVWGVAFSPDGERIGTVSRDGTARIWDASSGEELLRLIGHTGTVTSAFFSPDGKQLATTGRDGMTKIWDAKTGELLLDLYGDGEGLNGVAISPDGSRLATGGSHALRIYLLRLSDLVTLAKTRVTRSLTEEECRQYLHAAQCPVQP